MKVNFFFSHNFSEKHFFKKKHQKGFADYGQFYKCMHRLGQNTSGESDPEPTQPTNTSGHCTLAMSIDVM